jgi:hypothetical protein
MTTKTVRKPTHKQLVRSPTAMVKWLKAKRPNTVVTPDICSPKQCLLAKFFRAHGVRNVSVSGFTYWVGVEQFEIPDWFMNVFHVLPAKTPIRAQYALNVIRETQ